MIIWNFELFQKIIRIEVRRKSVFEFEPPSPVVIPDLINLHTLNLLKSSCSEWRESLSKCFVPLMARDGLRVPAVFWAEEITRSVTVDCHLKIFQDVLRELFIYLDVVSHLLIQMLFYFSLAHKLTIQLFQNRVLVFFYFLKKRAF